MLNRRIFRFTSWLVAIMGVLAVAFFILAIPFDDTATSEFFINLMAGMICAGFPIAMVMAITGLASRNLDKEKGAYVADFVDDDERLDNIMDKLSNDEKEYIQSLISAKRMGIADDGELTALDDLLNNDYDDNQRFNLTQ